MEISKFSWSEHLVRITSRCLPREVFRACNTRRKPLGQTKNQRDRLYLGWLGNASTSSEELVDVAGWRRRSIRKWKECSTSLTDVIFVLFVVFIELAQDQMKCEHVMVIKSRD